MCVGGAPAAGGTRSEVSTSDCWLVAALVQPAVVTVKTTWPQYVARSARAPEAGADSFGPSHWQSGRSFPTTLGAMRSVADVSTDDLVNSLLNSVTSSTSSPSTSTSSPSTSTTSTSTSTTSKSAASTSWSTSSSLASASHSASSASSDSETKAPATTSPATKSPATETPATTSPAASSSGSNNETATGGATDGSGDGGSGGVALSIGIAIGVLALVVATLLFLRSRRKRAQKARDSACSPPAGATCLTVPADRGFKQERELGMPEMSIELPPGHLGFSQSKGLDMSYASSRSSATSNQYNASVASSTDSSVFNTMGGVSPTFSSRKMASYSYQYRESEDGPSTNANPSLSSARSAGSTAFRLTGLNGSNAACGRGGNTKLTRVTSGRTLSAADEYAELVTATNAQGKVDMAAHAPSPQVMHADFTGSATSLNEMEISMGPDADNHSFLAPLPTRKTPASTQAQAVARASEVSMGPDSPVSGREKRTGSVYDTIPNLSGEKMSASSRSSEEDPNAMSTASFLSESSISSTSSRDSVATSARGSAYVSSMPLLQQLSSAEDSDYGEDLTSERASTESSDSANTTRSGSIIALNLEAKDGCSEIAI
ncbi:unnamed protein product [Phytophthora lilii]|uniref:Unnamed protein product n=1 Tax=Phytophthora lilii TaxID=2077276 RepID=A0A9W6U123_9STRA|nr:unnamed protein product [Phytophthora lilii]